LFLHYLGKQNQRNIAFYPISPVRVFPLKSGYFTDIASFSMKTVVDRHRHPAYQN